MSRTSKNALERKVPEMAHAIAASHGELAAAAVVSDRSEEENVRPAGGDLLLQTFIVGDSYWIETASWVYIGRVNAVGVDYVSICEACRVPLDGRHNVLMQTGKASGMEIELTGCTSEKGVRIMRLSIDGILSTCDWIHPIPTESV